MSIGVLITVHDGIVLAADSASTLMLQAMPVATAPPPNQPPPPAVINVYNNANKIANLFKGQPIGCVAYGAGSIGSASISALLKDFRARLQDGEEPTFNIKTYTVENVCQLLTNFLMTHVQQLPPQLAKPSLGILLGGYSAGKDFGEAWFLQIENGVAKPAVRANQGQDVCVSWGGEGEAVARLVLGYSPNLMQVLSNTITPKPQPLTLQQLNQHLMMALRAPIVFAPMPIQDTIDLAEFLVHTAIMYSRFHPRSSVGRWTN